jgi:hypothetical protein
VRMWFAWLRKLEDLREEGFSKASAWTRISYSTCKKREAVVKLAENLPTRLAKRLFKQPWQTALQCVEDALREVKAVESALITLRADLKNERGNHGELLVPLVHGRPRPTLTGAEQRNLKAFALHCVKPSEMERETVLMFAKEGELVENPDDRKPMKHRMHTAFSRIRKWLVEIESSTKFKTRPECQQYDEELTGLGLAAYQLSSSSGSAAQQPVDPVGVGVHHDVVDMDKIRQYVEKRENYKISDEDWEEFTRTDAAVRLPHPEQ